MLFINVAYTLYHIKTWRVKEKIEEMERREVKIIKKLVIPI